MRKHTLELCLVAAGLVGMSAAFCLPRPSAQEPVLLPPPAVVRLCGESVNGVVNGVWTIKENVGAVVEQLEGQGCLATNIVIINNSDGWYFIYGHKVYIGE